MESDLKYDRFFGEILQDKKSIVGFLQTVFDFLARRTDFYYESKSQGEGIGFPPGVKERLVFQAMQHCNPNRTSGTSRAHFAGQRDDVDEAPPEAREDEVSTGSCELAAEVCAEADSSESRSETGAKSKPAKIFQENEYYNGACFENYCWSQTIAEVELHILLPDNITSSKQLNITIEADRIAITEKSKPDHIIFGGKLSTKCRSSEAVWSLSNKKLQITLDKTTEMWWKQFLDSEPQIDLSRMDCSRSLEELPEETQAVIEKLRWDQQQKALGRPTSEDLEKESLLKKMWDAEGSPFKGQPFDPSLVQFS